MQSSNLFWTIQGLHLANNGAVRETKPEPGVYNAHDCSVTRKGDPKGRQSFLRYCRVIAVLLSCLWNVGGHAITIGVKDLCFDYTVPRIRAMSTSAAQLRRSFPVSAEVIIDGN